MKRCPSNHLQVEPDIYWVTHANGRRYRRCKICHATRMRLKYRNDDEWREKQKAKARGSYYARKATSESQLDHHGTAGA